MIMDKQMAPIKHKYTMIDDPKPDDEVIADIKHDIDMMINWWYKLEKNISTDIGPLIRNAKCHNTVHGLQIVNRLVMLDNVVLPDDFVFAAVLHDVVKYKKRTEVIRGVMDEYVGKGRWTDIGDHGINGGYLLSAIFRNVNIRPFEFVFMHSKNRPFQLNPSDWEIYEVAFFVIDDIIRDPKKYKTKLNKDQYDEIQKYYHHPTTANTIKVFNILSEYHNLKK